MKLSTQQKKMLLEAGKTNDSRVYAVDFGRDNISQSAFHRTCTSLVKKGLMEQSRYSNKALMNAYELTPQGRSVCEHIRAGKTVVIY